MANDKHYPAGTSGGKGGQFAPKGKGEGVEIETTPSISYVPKITSKGKKRYFFKDLDEGTKARMERDYIYKHFDILSQLDYLYDNFNTSKINTQERQLLRSKIVNDEFEAQLEKGPKEKGKKATLLLGLPGSGKSSIATPLSKEMGAFIVDADNFKNRIPEFQKDHKMVSAVHHESVDLANNFMNALSDQDYNMIIGKVGGDYESVKYILDDLHNKGYEIDVILNDLPFEEAIDRTIGRYDRGETDRLIPFWTLKVADSGVFDTFDSVLKHPGVKGGKIYSNDVPKGSNPLLLKEFKK